jgi:hypothetical protein
VAEQGTHKPLVVSSNLTLATLEDTAVLTVVFLLRGINCWCALKMLHWYETIMNQYYSDTHPKMEELQIKLLREVPGWRKMEMLVSLNAAARELAMAGLRRRYPNANSEEIRRRLADLLLGEELAQKVYGKPEYDV